MRWLTLWSLLGVFGCSSGSESASPVDNSNTNGPASDVGIQDAISMIDGGVVPDAAADMAVVIPSPCGQACTGNKVCDPVSEKCVECAKDDDCTTGVCDRNSNTCVDCITNANCETGLRCDRNTFTCYGCFSNADCGANSVCDIPTNSCVGCLTDNDCSDGNVCRNAGPLKDLKCVSCLENTHCPDAGSSRCQDSACVACVDATDCAHIPGQQQCLNGSCVACTLATETTDCFDGIDHFSCDPATNTCSTFKMDSGYDCQPCISTSSCHAEYSCVATSYKGAPNGSYCLRNFAGVTCDRPYGAGVKTVRDVTNNIVTVCTINELLTSCGAHEQFGELCTSDADCDADGSFCYAHTANTSTCLMACTFSDDCPYYVDCKPRAIGKICDMYN